MAPKAAPKNCAATPKTKVTSAIVKKTPPIRAVKPLTYGCDFAGLGTMSLAIKRNAQLCPSAFVPHHLFSCDNLPASEAFIRVTSNPVAFHKDILTRTDADLPDSLDLYSWTSPCQGLSSAGCQLGAKDPRTKLLFKSIEFIRKVKPKAFIMENVPMLATFAKNKDLWQTILGELTACGYKIEHAVVNTSDYLPQNRARLYAVGLRNDVKRTNAKGVPVFPTPPPRRILTLKDIIQVLPSDKWAPFPDQKANKLAYSNVVNAYRSLPAGVNPFLTPVVVDARSSARFSSSRTGEFPTLTKTRSSQFGYWVSTKGGWVSLAELAALQGYFGDDFPVASAHISKAQAGGMLGNSQSLPLVQDLLAHTMYHAQLLTYDQFMVTKRAMYASWGF